MKKFAFGCVLLSLAGGAAIAQTITVTSPNGRENWPQGSQKTITWRSEGVTGNVRILLFQGGANIGIVKDDVPVTRGSIDWTVGNFQGGTAAPDTNYRIRIRKMQADIMDSSDGTFTIAPPETAHTPTTPLAPPQSPSSITVTSPNGGETWLLKALGPNTASVSWTVSHLGGNANIILKKGGNPVRSITVPIGGSCQFSYADVAEGDDYRIRVENTDRTFGDESDREFSIKRETRVPRVVTPAFLTLRVLDFKLDNGAETTSGPIVTMNHRVVGTPTYYRWRTEVRPDWGPWVRYMDAEPKATLPETFGEHTIFFQVKNNDGEASPISDAIIYSADKEYDFGPGFLNVCPCRFDSSDWKWSVIERSFPQSLSPDPTEVTCADPGPGDCYRTIVIEVKQMGYMMVQYGGKSEFEFFAGRQLNDGWSFVRLEYEGQEGGGRGYRITRMPQPGSRDITFRVRVWADVGSGSCVFKIKNLIVKGPSDHPVSEAFR